ncbi:Vacuolar protein sorting-associated protein 72 [Coemansia sp. RSA 989]|nr:Vacuolar protein sorting-associated protein 72 [Coemansia sp. RSA 1086]KAJ1749454.1 Vacuolar protein sorting-associated protein 72 [Coemansia sp. RSA 1821]KAJ1863500.1 Vacuolar protein sorting-associated protein 72 [Coemansia sp. RSA 989]KAJ1871398.1 Vacuolar protein sorting-associated protein 72 [Coemansia sp. RSA 990]KAJ2669587.1 Vacuolar protein sorting-associated protein 72 [Coemansia sp. RSA 1085]
MALSTGRSRRQNAGNKMSAMIEEERAKIESGDIVPSDEDKDFTRKDEGEDIIDSDFEETDSEAERAAEEVSKQVEELLEKAERRKQRKQARKRIVPLFASSKSKPTVKPEPKPFSSTPRRTKQPEFAVRFSSRASAVRKARESEALELEREELAAIKRKRNSTKRRKSEPLLTQEQLLEEAKQTEVENLEKLKEFQNMEAQEKQQQRRLASRKKPLMVQPISHWESRLVPEISAPAGAISTAAHIETNYSLKQLDDEEILLNPWISNAPTMPPKLCPITGKPARYFHPRVKVPYSDARAYRILEELANGHHAFFYDIDVWNSTEIP